MREGRKGRRVEQDRDFVGKGNRWWSGMRGNRKKRNWE